MTAPVPAGFRLAFDPSVKQLTENLWYGGSPVRVLRLTPAGRSAWRELSDGPVASAAAGVLARRISDAGFAHPVPPEPARTPDITVVIPVRDRPEMLARCLDMLDDVQVIVVDDGSADADAVAEVVGRRDAKLVRRPVNGGPAAARNTGLDVVTSELVAFLDSDCVPDRGWLGQLAAHFADPLVAAVAPRITGLAGDCGLDLGDQAARVVPNTRVSFVPTAALVVRRSALLEVAGDGPVFDPAMRVGEDVDLVWRLHEAGWRIRYDPTVRVGHEEPTAWTALLSRRFRYGTSAAPLALRHPRSVPPLVLQPRFAVTVFALLGGRPLVAVASWAASVLAMRHTLRKSEVPAAGTERAMLSAVWHTWLGLGRYGVQYASPVLLAVLAAPGGRTSTVRIRRRLAAASLLLGPALAAWATRRPRPNPIRFVLRQLADDVAYGSGVWAGCLRHRTVVALTPVVAGAALRVDGPSDRQEVHHER